MLPEHRQERRQEIDALWTDIQRMEREHGWDVGAQDTATGVEPPPVAADAGSDEAAVQATSATSPSGDKALPEPARDMCHQKDGDRGQQCNDVCRLAGSICDNADSICRIARELGGDPWAVDRCANARNSCTRADERCCHCGEQALACHQVNS